MQHERYLQEIQDRNGPLGYVILGNEVCLRVRNEDSPEGWETTTLRAPFGSLESAVAIEALRRDLIKRGCELVGHMAHGDDGTHTVRWHHRAPGDVVRGTTKLSDDPLHAFFLAWLEFDDWQKREGGD